jgi:Ca2+-binding EF-hand superfamily protein
VLLRAVDQNPSKKEFFEALIEANLTNKEELTLEDFELLAGHIWEDEPSDEILKKAFAKMDKNHDGTIMSRHYLYLSDLAFSYIFY